MRFIHGLRLVGATILGATILGATILGATILGATILGATILGATILAATPFAAHAQSSPVVVELYTSQGCSSCPPADALLGELAERPGVIALSLHVDYWDYLGWRDPFGSHENTERQRDYAAALGSREIYTPQMVVQGAHGMVGSMGQVVEMAIKGYAEKPAAARVALTRRGGTLEVEITPTGGGGGGGEIWLFGYDAAQETQIERGENGGRSFTYHNVVRERRRLGDWSGAVRSLSADIDPARHGYAVLVQLPGPGRVLGAAKSESGEGS